MKIQFTFLLLLILINGTAQTLISTAGKDGSAGNYTFSWSMGELVTTTSTAGNIIATQGYQQPYWAVTNTSVSTITFNTGWNIFSISNYPDSADLKYNFQPLINNTSLVKIQDELGNSLEDWGIFGGWQNNIGDISPTEGYKIKVNFEDSLKVYGVPVEYPFGIPLQAGWNIMGYPQTAGYNGMDIVQQLIDAGTLIKVQDEQGNSIEDWGIFGGWQNNIGNFAPGEGYKIKVNADDTLWIYESYTKSIALQPPVATTMHFKPVFEGNGLDHMNFNIGALPHNLLQPGDELAVFDGGICAGAVTILKPHLENQGISIAASAADGEGMAGFIEGNEYTLKLWKSGQYKEVELQPEIVTGPDRFVKHESVLMSLEKYAVTGWNGLEIPGLTDVKCYPNPFSEEITVELNLAENVEIQVVVLNQMGQQINFISTKKHLKQGIHHLKWDGKNVSGQKVAPGIYYFKINVDKKVHYLKFVSAG